MTQVGDNALRECASRLGYSFINEDLLRVALIHRSWQAEHDSAESNERLEFLGDAVLGWAVADIAYHRLADMHEGKLTDLRISVVNMNALADRARALGIGEFIFLGKGEDAAGGRDKSSILSDTFEALIGAVYLDGGASAAYDLVHRLLSDTIENAIPTVTEGEGPDHERVFTTAVYVDGRVQGRGTGRTKKAAEQAAAVEACGVLAHADNA